MYAPFETDDDVKSKCETVDDYGGLGCDRRAIVVWMHCCKARSTSIC